jgi:hypothetical protein
MMQLFGFTLSACALLEAGPPAGVGTDMMVTVPSGAALVVVGVPLHGENSTAYSVICSALC